MKRTTLALDEDLLQELKERAARERRTFQALTNDLLRRAITEDRVPTGYRLQLQGWRASTQAGVDLLDRDQLFDRMDGR